MQVARPDEVQEHIFLNEADFLFPALKYVNGVIVGLRCLYGIPLAKLMVCRRTVAQGQVLATFCQAAAISAACTAPWIGFMAANCVLWRAGAAT